MAKGPDCYKCRHRADVPGSAHSQCMHPGSGNDDSNPLLGLLARMGKRVGPTPPPATATVKVTGNPHGIKSGWFNWPFNFDPVWLESCDGFSRREETP